LPPDIWQYPLYFTPTFAAFWGHVSVSGVFGCTVKPVTAWVAVCAGELPSVTFTVKELVPAAEGTPVICPVEVLKLRPGGSEPLMMEYVNGATPPTA
jgi:hypothetical protein